MCLARSTAQSTIGTESILPPVPTQTGPIQRAPFVSVQSESSTDEHTIPPAIPKPRLTGVQSSRFNLQSEPLERSPPLNLIRSYVPPRSLHKVLTGSSSPNGER